MFGVLVSQPSEVAEEVMEMETTLDLGSLMEIIEGEERGDENSFSLEEFDVAPSLTELAYITTKGYSVNFFTTGSMCCRI